MLLKLKNKAFKLDFWNIVVICTYLIFAIFLLYPLFSLFLSSFQNTNGQGFTLGNYIKFFTKRYYYSALINSFSITIIVTILAMLIGAPLAYIMNSIKIKGKNILEILIIISLLSPPFIGAYSWILLLGRSGVVTQFLEKFGIHIPTIYGFKGILLAFTLKLFPFIYLYVSGALKK